MGWTRLSFQGQDDPVLCFSFFKSGIRNLASGVHLSFSLSFFSLSFFFLQPLAHGCSGRHLPAHRCQGWRSPAQLRAGARGGSRWSAAHVASARDRLPRLRAATCQERCLVRSRLTWSKPPCPRPATT
jgi:hypothetical protein